MPVTPLPRVSARILQKNIPIGRSTPDIVRCVEEKTAVPGDYVVKLKAVMESGVSGSGREVVCAHLAGLLGIPVPPAAIVDVSAPFVDSIEDPVRQVQYAKSRGDNFGSEHQIGGLATWPTDSPIFMSSRQTCLECFAFDVLIQNPDRTAGRPNLLFRGDAVFLYDHEVGFSNIDAIGGSKVQELSSKNLNFFIKDHAFYTQLKGRPVDLERMEGALKAVGAKELQAIKNDVPDPWRTDKLDPILGYLADVAADPGRLTRTVQEILA